MTRNHRLSVFTAIATCGLAVTGAAWAQQAPIGELTYEPFTAGVPTLGGIALLLLAASLAWFALHRIRRDGLQGNALPTVLLGTAALGLAVGGGESLKHAWAVAGTELDSPTGGTVDIFPGYQEFMNTSGLNQRIDQLIKAIPDLEIPEGVVREEAASMAAQMIQSQGQQVDPELVQKLVEPFMEQAGHRVRAGLLMGELAHQNSIRIDSNKVREAIETAASTYEEPAEVVQLYYNNQQLMNQVESSVLEEQVVDWVLENAKVTPKEMKFQEVITAATNRT